MRSKPYATVWKSGSGMGRECALNRFSYNSFSNRARPTVHGDALTGGLVCGTSSVGAMGFDGT